MIRFVETERSKAASTKAALCAWFERRGRTDYVEGVIDGVVAPLTEVEISTARTDEERLSTASVALYDTDLSVLEFFKETIIKRFGVLVDVMLHDIPLEAWQQCWNDEFVPWHSERFLIVPLEVEQKETEFDQLGLRRIVIDARGGAFGTGQHRTTRCLIHMLEKHAAHWQPQSVLDVGTGTGILLIASAHLGAKSLVGTEIDHELVALAQQNCARNKVHAHIQLLDTPASTGTFDLVIANILVPVLHTLMPDLAQVTANGGRLLLAGFVAKEAAPLLELSSRYGFQLEQQMDEGGWLGIVLRKSAS